MFVFSSLGVQEIDRDNIEGYASESVPYLITKRRRLNVQITKKRGT